MYRPITPKLAKAKVFQNPDIVHMNLHPNMTCTQNNLQRDAVKDVSLETLAL